MHGKTSYTKILDQHQELKPHTHRGHASIGLQPGKGLWEDNNCGKHIVIGILDSGLCTTHPSFKDNNLPKPPLTWKGKPEHQWNNKIISEKSFEVNECGQSYDQTEHGTHCASVAAGNYVRMSKDFAMAGVAPLAHLATYKVGGLKDEKFDFDGAINPAIEDKVDIISISRSFPPIPFYLELIAKGSFRAMERGILVCCLAGNNGPTYQSLTNDAPWILTVGASDTGSDKGPSIYTSSSRGPSIYCGNILKPDIVAPGVNISAAWPLQLDHGNPIRSQSGTSVACAHIAGVAALVKSSHRDWKTDRIKSAIMTTADPFNMEGNLIGDVLTIGSGQVNTRRVNDPGLVFDMSLDSYISYLCGLFKNDHNNLYSLDYKVSLVVGRTVDCSRVKKIRAEEFNYPSFFVNFGVECQTHTRTVTNVEDVNSIYIVEIDLPDNVDVKVEPSMLKFGEEVGQKMSFDVTFTLIRKSNIKWSQGSIKWKSLCGKYSMRSPIVVHLNI